MFKKIRAMFSSFRGSHGQRTIDGAKHIVSSLVGWLVSISKFELMKDNDVFEQLYQFETDVGSSIDKFSSMVSCAFRMFTTPSVGDTLDKIEKDMVERANFLIDDLEVHDDIESLTEMLMIHGNIFVARDKQTSLWTIQPNSLATLLDVYPREMSDRPITQANFLVINENNDDEVVYTRSEFIHIKYKKTPVWHRDLQGRDTFGIYSVSPLTRAVLPGWQKRQLNIVEILRRWRSLPREHHKLSSDMFALNQYVGDKASKRTQSREDAEATLSNYVAQQSQLMPDEAHATLDTVDISVVEPTSASYTSPNQYIDQLNEQLWSAVSVPKSLATGTSNSTYASELVVSRFTADKITQIANKVKRVILLIMRERLLSENPLYPVHLLNFKIEYEMANSRLEAHREALILAEIGLWTEQELREFLGWQNLREDQRPFLVKLQSQSSSSQDSAEKQSSETSNSQTGHETDPGKGMYKETENQ